MPAVSPIANLGPPDPERRRCPAHLTRGQIEASPAFDPELPVLRPVEAAHFGHYALPPYWVDDAGAVPGLEAAGNRGTKLPLLSAAAIIGNSVEVTDGDAGHVEDLLVDTEYWDIRYITVHTSS